MADIEELRNFLLSVQTLFGHCSRSYLNKDTVSAEYCKNKLENYGAIIVAMAVAVSESETDNAEELVGTTEARTSLSALLSEFLSAMESAQIKLSEVLETLPAGNLCNLPSTLQSTGGRPAFDIKKEHIEQSRDAGMDWKAISRFLGISEKTLQRRRAEFGLTANFCNISDSDLDRQVAEILQLTPYSGESYVRRFKRATNSCSTRKSQGKHPPC